MTNISSNLTSDLDDDGNPLYLYENAPLGGVEFNVKIREGCRSWHVRNEHGGYNEYVVQKNDYDKTSTSTGIPTAYRYVQSKDFKYSLYSNVDLAKDARNRMIKFVENYRKFEDRGVGLYIHSPSTGSGKTLLACIIANGLIRRYNEQPRFIKASVFFEEYKREMKNLNNDSYRNEDKMKQITQAKILIIDDLGAKKATDYISSLMYEIISKRTDLRKVTIITSRKALSELKAINYDASTISKIGSSTRPIDLPNEDVGVMTASEDNEDLDEILKKV